MPRKKPEQNTRLVTVIEIVGPQTDVDRAEATISAVLGQYLNCKIRKLLLADAPKVPHAS